MRSDEWVLCWNENVTQLRRMRRTWESWRRLNDDGDCHGNTRDQMNSQHADPDADPETMIYFLILHFSASLNVSLVLSTCITFPSIFLCIVCYYLSSFESFIAKHSHTHSLIIANPFCGRCAENELNSSRIDNNNINNVTLTPERWISRMFLLESSAAQSFTAYS